MFLERGWTRRLRGKAERRAYVKKINEKECKET